MMVYKYRLHDPDSGKVLYEGTAADLAAQGVVRAEKILADPDPLQLDVRDLEGYNAKARECGKKELSYGYWAAEGKPAAPAW